MDKWVHLAMLQLRIHTVIPVEVDRQKYAPSATTSRIGGLILKRLPGLLFY